MGEGEGEGEMLEESPPRIARHRCVRAGSWQSGLVCLKQHYMTYCTVTALLVVNT
jgi:hypothetical protein